MRCYEVDCCCAGDWQCYVLSASAANGECRIVRAGAGGRVGHCHDSIAAVLIFACRDGVWTHGEQLVVAGDVHIVANERSVDAESLGCLASGKGGEAECGGAHCQGGRLFLCHAVDVEGYLLGASAVEVDSSGGGAGSGGSVLDGDGGASHNLVVGEAGGFYCVVLGTINGYRESLGEVAALNIYRGGDGVAHIASEVEAGLAGKNPGGDALLQHVGDAVEGIDDAVTTLLGRTGGVDIGRGATGNGFSHLIEVDLGIGLQQEGYHAGSHRSCHGGAAHLAPVVVASVVENPVGISVGAGAVIAVERGDHIVAWCGDKWVVHTVAVGAIAGEIGDIVDAVRVVGRRARRHSAHADCLAAGDVVAHSAVGLSLGEGITVDFAAGGDFRRVSAVGPGIDCVACGAGHDVGETVVRGHKHFESEGLVVLAPDVHDRSAIGRWCHVGSTAAGLVHDDKWVAVACESLGGEAGGVGLVACGKQDDGTILVGNLVIGATNAARAIVRTGVVSQADADDTGLALRLGIVGNIFGAIGNRRLAHARPQSAQHQVALGSHAGISVDERASGAATGVRAVTLAIVVGGEACNLLGGGVVVATQRGGAHGGVGAAVGVGGVGQIGSLDACVAVTVKKCAMVEVDTAVNHSHHNAVALVVLRQAVARAVPCLESFGHVLGLVGHVACLLRDGKALNGGQTCHLLYLVDGHLGGYQVIKSSCDGHSQSLDLCCGGAVEGYEAVDCLGAVHFVDLGKEALAVVLQSPCGIVVQEHLSGCAKLVVGNHCERQQERNQ